MFYFKIFLAFLWSGFAFIIGFFYALMRWGNVDTNHVVGRILSWGVLRILRIQVDCEGLEHLESSQPCIYVANHQSALDVATFASLFPHRTIVIGKKQLFWMPILGIYYVASGNILINREKRAQAYEGLAKAVETIQKKGVSIWIFPEGTRNVSKKGLLHFKRGAFHIAVKAKIPIVPIVSSSLAPVFDPESRRIRPGVVKIKILPPIDPSSYDETQLDPLNSKTRDIMLAALRGLNSC